MYGCTGSPGAQSLFFHSYCRATVQWPTKVSGLGVYLSGNASDWELVPVEGEEWGYRIRTPECSYNPESDTCWYWAMGVNNWVHVNTLDFYRRTEGDVFYIKPFAKGWKIFPRRDDCDMAAHSTEPCLRSLAWGAGSQGVKYVGMWSKEFMYHFTFEPLARCRQAHWAIEKDATQAETIKKKLGSPC